MFYGDACKLIDIYGNYIEANLGPNGCHMNRPPPSVIYMLFEIVYCTTKFMFRAVALCFFITTIPFLLENVCIVVCKCAKL